MSWMNWRCHNRKFWKPKQKDTSPWVTPWGPYCLLNQNRRPEPFNKTQRGKARRAERKFKATQQEIEICSAC